MQIQKVNAQQNPNFGTAYVSLDKDGLSQLSQIAQKRVHNILTKGADIVQVSDDLMVLSEHPNKDFRISHLTDKILFRFTHQNPKKEQQIVGIFKKLFGDGVIHTNIIENTAENTARIEAANKKQERWLADINIPNILERAENSVMHYLEMEEQLNELDYSLNPSIIKE